jgi:hypothetical protein
MVACGHVVICVTLLMEVMIITASRKGPRGRCRIRWTDNIKRTFRETCERLEWFEFVLVRSPGGSF